LFRLILLFTLLPLVELSLLLRIGEWLGVGATIGLVVVTGVAGAWLARREGLRTWGRVQSELGAGRMPGDELVHALLVFVAGLVLVTPGVVTDCVGLLLLIRPVRERVARSMRRRLAARIQVQGVGFGHPGAGRAPGMRTAGTPDGGEKAPSGGRVIEIQ